MVLIAAVFGILGKHIYKRRHRVFNSNKSIGIILVLFIFAVNIIFVFNFLFSNTCVLSHPDEVTLKLTELFNRDDCCMVLVCVLMVDYNDDACHVYLAFGKNTSSEAVVHFHASRQYSSYYVYYGPTKVDNFTDYPFRSVPYVHYMSTLDYYTNRYVYYGYLGNLLPNTVYYFTIVAEGRVIDHKLYRSFKTTPIDDRPIRFITGGDLGATSEYSLVFYSIKIYISY